MANKAITMLQIRRLLQLLISGFSERQIATELGMSRNTIATYVKRFKFCEKSFADLFYPGWLIFERASLKHAAVVAPSANHL